MKVGIIGFGPRGLYSLERLVASGLIKDKINNIQIIVFEPNQDLATGKAWKLNQSTSNWINISDHALQNLKGRAKIHCNGFEIPAFPGYSNWCIENKLAPTLDTDIDVYPPRSQMGTYLNARALSITDLLVEKKILTVEKTKIKSVIVDDAHIKISNLKGNTWNVDECVLTIGHQPTQLSEEEKKNMNHSNTIGCLYIHSPYEFNIKNKIACKQNVAIIGYGLTMIDITRMLISDLNGEFKNLDDSYLLKYEFENYSNLRIIPYSFDGLPCVPKPYGRVVDTNFKPSENQKNKFELEIKNTLSNGSSISSSDFLLQSFSKVAASIFLENQKDKEKSKLGTTAIEELIIDWLKDSKVTHQLILDTSQNPRSYMVACVEMSLGLKTFSLDFTIGQIWRHLQPLMYRLFAFSSLPDAVMKEIIEIDERTKRYSYGPPVESILQLIALNDAGILDLDYVNDPEITLNSEGWEFSNDHKKIVCPTLINSVLNAPAISKINSEIVKSLRNQGLIKEVAEGLGAKTHKNSLLVGINSEIKPIALIGRNAKGNVLGTDAILECFSPEIEEWAEGLFTRA